MNGQPRLTLYRAWNTVVVMLAGSILLAMVADVAA